MKVLTVFSILIALSACNTIRGAGEDISTGGEAISETASEVQSEL